MNKEALNIVDSDEKILLKRDAIVKIQVDEILELLQSDDQIEVSALKKMLILDSEVALEIQLKFYTSIKAFYKKYIEIMGGSGEVFRLVRGMIVKRILENSLQFQLLYSVIAFIFLYNPEVGFKLYKFGQQFYVSVKDLLANEFGRHSEFVIQESSVFVEESKCIALKPSNSTLQRQDSLNENETTSKARLNETSEIMSTVKSIIHVYNDKLKLDCNLCFIHLVPDLEYLISKNEQNVTEFIRQAIERRKAGLEDLVYLLRLVNLASQETRIKLKDEFYKELTLIFKQKLLKCLEQYNTDILEGSLCSGHSIIKEFFESSLVFIENNLFTQVYCYLFNLHEVKSKFYERVSEFINNYDVCLQIYIYVFKYEISHPFWLKMLALKLETSRELEHYAVLDFLFDHCNYYSEETKSFESQLHSFKSDTSILLDKVTQSGDRDSYIIKTAVSNMSQVIFHKKGSIIIIPSHCLKHGLANLPNISFYSIEDLESQIMLMKEKKISIYPYISYVVADFKIGGIRRIENMKFDLLQYGLLQMLLKNKNGIEIKDLENDPQIGVDSRLIEFSISIMVKSELIVVSTTKSNSTLLSLNRAMFSRDMSDVDLSKYSNMNFRMFYFCNTNFLKQSHTKSLNVFDKESIENYHLSCVTRTDDTQKSLLSNEVGPSASHNIKRDEMIIDCYIMKLLKKLKQIAKSEITESFRREYSQSSQLQGINADRLNSRIQNLLHKGMLNEKNELISY